MSSLGEAHSKVLSISSRTPFTEVALCISSFALPLAVLCQQPSVDEELVGTVLPDVVFLVLSDFPTPSQSPFPPNSILSNRYPTAQHDSLTT